MYTFISRRLRFFLVLGLSLCIFSVYFQLYSGSLRSTITSARPILNGERLTVQNEDEERPSNGNSSPTNIETEGEEGPSSSVPHSNLDVAKPATWTTGLAAPTPTPLSGAIVAAVGTKTNISWISEVQNPMWKLHRYNHDDPSPPPSTYFPVNRGNEAMMYLSYIINNYDSLPDYSIFIHGHRQSWHQEGDMVDIINNFRLPALERAGYAPLRCDWYPSCPREIRPVHHDAVVWGPGVHREDTEIEIGRVWTTLFGQNVTLPETIASQCCAQFAVTRKAILQRSKAEYERMRQWLLDTDLINDVSGRVFEKLWAYIFTKEAIRCPPPQQCACEYFGQCRPKLWPIPPSGLEKWPKEFDNLPAPSPPPLPPAPVAAQPKPPQSTIATMTRSSKSTSAVDEETGAYHKSTSADIT